MKAFKLNKLFWIVFVISTIIQLFLIGHYGQTSQTADPGAYRDLAYNCYNKGEWYPTLENVYSSYIWAPGFINWLILQLKIFGTLQINMFLNIFLNAGIIYFIYIIANRFFSTRTAYISCIIWCLLYSNWWQVIKMGTEIPFLFCCLAAFILCLKDKKWAYIVAGILFFIANWIRPLALAFIITILIYMIITRKKLLNYFLIIIPFVICTLFIGISVKNKIGYFNVQSTTSGFNLIMSANEKAYGGVATTLFDDTTTICYVENIKDMTFIQRDSIYKARALQWIKENPLKWSKLFFVKIAGLYVEDSYPDRPILGGANFVNSIAQGEANKSSISSKITHMFLGSIIYYIVLVLFVISIIKKRKDLLSYKALILIILILGTGATCIFSVSPAYHYPYLFVIIIWAAHYLSDYKLFRHD